MKLLHATSIILGVVLSAPGPAQQAAQPATDQRGLSDQGTGKGTGEASGQSQTPAQQKIAAAKQQIETDPKKLQAYNALALAYIRRARETADPNYLNDADAAIAEGMKLDATDFQLQKTQVALLLSRHDYAKAREQATALHHRTPDDVMTYGYLAEADMGLGDYPDAETNAQWMMNMRPNNTPALLVGAGLRVLYGDAHGAIDFLNRAFAQTSPIEVEDQAWIANQIASIQIDSGQNDAAEQTLERAEQLFPHYPYTTENLARVRMAQNRASDAAQLWTQAKTVDHNPHVAFELAKSEEAAGQMQEAHSTLAEFEKLASAPDTLTDEATLDLVLMYAENAGTAPDALKLAQQLIQSRRDVWTLDAYAWALYANGNFKDADAAEQEALAVGVQNAQIFDHAGHIAGKMNRSDDAGKYFKLAVQSNSTSTFAADAMKFANLAAPADDHNQKVMQSAAAPDVLSTPLRQEAPIASAKPDSNATPVRGEMSHAAPAFAPVPEALLTPQPTGTDRLIHNAQGTVGRNPKDAQAYAGLGAAYFQRARETGDVSDYQQAEESLTKSLDLVSVDFSADAALGTMAEVCMGEHRFDDALMYSQKALSLGTGDVSPFAIVGDAYADMGEYDKAAVAYGRLTPRDMTLAPRAAYARDSRLSYLKFIAGDTPAAIGLMKTAITEGVEAQLQSENLAWLYYELGEYETQAGDAASADAAYLAALNTHLGDYRALAALGKLRANNGRYAEAIVLYQRAIAVVPMPIFIAELGDLYAKQGNQVEAQKQYALVEYIGLLGHINQVLHNRDLALFYADHDVKVGEALDLAQKELEVRRDVYTWDALAWALYKNGKLTDAAKASEKAMQFGTRDSILLFHAGMIAQAQGQAEKARAELKEALDINPHFHLIYADAAHAQLATLGPQLEAKGGSNEHAR
jgi:tetratricopeptide (TPR) repeat protein